MPKSSSIRFHSKRRHKNARRSDARVSRSADWECKASDKLATAATRMTAMPANLSGGSPCSRVPDFLDQVELDNAPSVDRGSEQHFPAFNVSVCENQTPIHPQPLPMSFLRRAVSHIQSLSTFGKHTRAYHPAFIDNDEFSNDSQYSAPDAYGNGQSQNSNTQHVLHLVHQGTEQSDTSIVLRDLQEASSLSASGQIVVGTWPQLLFGENQVPASRQSRVSSRHLLKYVRTSCTCLQCLVHEEELPARPAFSHTSHDIPTLPFQQQTLAPSFTSPAFEDQISYIPASSALANFVALQALPHLSQLRELHCEESDALYQIGTLVRLHSREGAKLSFLDKVKPFFKQLSYTGPLSHEEMYRKVTTIGVDYYQYNKGPKSRRVYIKGKQIRVPIKLGIVKLGTRPLYFQEEESKYILYRQQVVQIFTGQIVLEGNTHELDSHIPTQIDFFIGFGEKDGCAPVCLSRGSETVGTLGPPRRLGINELLLHHHMVEALELQIR